MTIPTSLGYLVFLGYTYYLKKNTSYIAEKQMPKPIAYFSDNSWPAK